MSIEDRIRAELRAQGSRLRVPAGDLRAVSVRGRSQRRGRLLVALGSAAIVVSAIAGGGMLLSGGEGDGAPVGNGDTVTTTSATSETATSTVAVSSPTAPPPVAGEAIVVATPDGIVTVRNGEVVDRFDTGPIMSAFDDFAGGHVVQIGMSASSILHLPAGRDDLDEMIPAAAGETLTLHDVVALDGSATVVYTSRLSGVSPQEAREDLRVYDIATGEDRLVAQVGGYESGASQVSYADGRFVVTMNAEGVTWFEAYEPSGDSADFPGNPRTEAHSADHFLVWVGVGALSADGETFAFLEGSPRSEAPFRFVVVGLPSGDRLREVPVDGVREDNVQRLDWDGARAVISMAGEPAVVIGDGPVTNRLPVPGIASFAAPD